MTRKTVIKIPSEIRYIKRVSSKITESLKAYDIEDSKLFDIRLCVEEAVRNGITHGNNSDKRLPVRVTYWIKEGDLNVEVEDAGSGFDHKKLPDPTTDDNILRNSGRGVYLIKNLMDDVEFNDTGNKIKMTKYLE